MFSRFRNSPLENSKRRFCAFEGSSAPCSIAVTILGLRGGVAGFDVGLGRGLGVDDDPLTYCEYVEKNCRQQIVRFGTH